ncbi:MAG: cupin domain-containing protein [Mycobacteriales bacterium]
MKVWASADATWFHPPGHYGELQVSNVVDWATGRNVQVQCSQLPPGSGKELHTHEDAAQLYVVLAGEFRFDTGAEPLRLQPLQAVLFEPGDPHAICNDGTEPGTVLVTTIRYGPAA